MRKGELTKERIIKQASELLNQKGYYSVSLSEIMAVTGLQKGGIYNHFGSKEELALQVFEYNVGALSRLFSEVLRTKKHAIERIIGFAHVTKDLLNGVPFAGGCAIMNAAIEADDALPYLREQAAAALQRMHRMMERTLQEGIEKGQLKADIDPASVATVVIAAMEGALMMSRLLGDRSAVDQTLEFLKRYLESEVKAGS